MNELSKEYIISFYNKALGMYGDKPAALRWTANGQVLRYLGLLDIGRDLSGKKVLDYGCGKGDFYRFLKERGIAVRYTGFDINERLIALASGKFPERRFKVFDIETDALQEDFDYIFICGVFNLKVQGIEETIKNTLIKLFSRCRTALAFNGLSAHNPEKDFELHYVFPEEISGFAARNLSPFITIKHDVIPYDFTIFIYRDDKRR